MTLKKIVFALGFIIPVNLILGMEENKNCIQGDIHKTQDIIKECQKLNQLYHLMPINQTNNNYQNVENLLYEQENESTKIDEELASEVLQNCSKELKEIIRAFEMLASDSPKEEDDEILLKYIPKALLFVGPKGCGKSTLAKIISQKSNIPCQFISSHVLMSQSQNSVIQNLNLIFAPIFESNNPVIIIFNKINELTQGIGHNSNLGIVEHFRLLIDRCKEKNNGFVIGTTSDATKLPQQLKDCFCVDTYQISMPNSEAKKRIILRYAIPDNDFSTFLGSWPLWWFMSYVKNFSPCELKELVKKANLFARIRKRNSPPDTKLELTINDLYQAYTQFNNIKRLI